MDAHRSGVDREAGSGPRRLTAKARAALAALAAAARQLGPASRRRLIEHIETEITHEEETAADRRRPPRGDQA